MKELIILVPGDSVRITETNGRIYDHTFGMISDFYEKDGREIPESAYEKKPGQSLRTVWLNLDPAVITLHPDPNETGKRRISVIFGDHVWVDSPRMEEHGEWVIKRPRPGYAEGDNPRMVRPGQD